MKYLFSHIVLELQSQFVIICALFSSVTKDDNEPRRLFLSFFSWFLANDNDEGLSLSFKDLVAVMLENDNKSLSLSFGDLVVALPKDNDKFPTSSLFFSNFIVIHEGTTCHA